MVHYPLQYIVYGGQDEPLGLLNYGGQRYYSDGPPWVSPTALAEAVYQNKRGHKIQIAVARAVSNEVWELAQKNEQSGKWKWKRCPGGS